MKPVRWIWSVRGATLLCGALLVLAFPAVNFEYLAWFGLVPGLVLIVRSPTAREGGIRAWWLGTGYLIAALYWMAPEIGPAVLLVAAVFGVLWVPFGVAAQKLLRPPLSWPRALAALVVVPSCWLLTEWLRSWQAVGGIRGQPVAASRRARAGRRGRRLDDQLRARAEQCGHRAPAAVPAPGRQ